jgi:hypothetical protein
MTAKAIATTAATPAATPPTMAPVLAPELADGVLEALAAAEVIWLRVVSVVPVWRSGTTLLSDVTAREDVVRTTGVGVITGEENDVVVGVVMDASVLGVWTVGVLGGVMGIIETIGVVVVGESGVMRGGRTGMVSVGLGGPCPCPIGGKTTVSGGSSSVISAKVAVGLNLSSRTWTLAALRPSRALALR